MAQVYVSIGSNQQREYYILSCLDALADSFGELQLSSVFESEAVGFTGDNFYNMVVGFGTTLGVADLSRALKAIEDANGRTRTGPKFSGRTLDIDILTYDQRTGDCEGVSLPRDEILKNAFVLWPLAQIAPQALHPVTGQSYAELWQGYDRSRQVLWPVAFSWRGQVFSSPE